MAQDGRATDTLEAQAPTARHTALMAVLAAGEDITVELVGIEVDEDVVALSFSDGRRLTFDPLELRTAILL